MYLYTKKNIYGISSQRLSLPIHFNAYRLSTKITVTFMYCVWPQECILQGGSTIYHGIKVHAITYTIFWPVSMNFGHIWWLYGNSQYCNKIKKFSKGLASSTKEKEELVQEKRYGYYTCLGGRYINGQKKKRGFHTPSQMMRKISCCLDQKNIIT